MRRLSWRFWPRVICVALAFAATGCWGNDDLPRQPVYGTVTLDGKLLQQGVITFYPAEKMIKGPIVVSGDMIKNGRFGVSRKFGLIPGRYKVAVYSRPASTRRRDADDNPGSQPEPPLDLVPVKYNSATRLEIEVKPYAIKELNLSLVSK